MERQLSDTKMELAETEKDLRQIKTENRETKQTLLAEQEEIKQEPLSLKTDTLTLAINRRMQKVRGNESRNTADAFMDKNKRLLEKVIEAVKSERSKKYFS